MTGVEVVTAPTEMLGGAAVWLFFFGFALAAASIVSLPFRRKRLRPGPPLALIGLGFALVVTSIVLDGRADDRARGALIEAVNEHYGIELTSLPRPGDEHTFAHDGRRLTVMWDQSGTRVVVFDGAHEYEQERQ